MKLMRLSPVAQRLRRVAKAHAAGETSLQDYRQARRQLLAEIVPLPVRKVDDTSRGDRLQIWPSARPRPGDKHPNRPAKYPHQQSANPGSEKSVIAG